MLTGKSLAETHKNQRLIDLAGRLADLCASAKDSRQSQGSLSKININNVRGGGGRGDGLPALRRGLLAQGGPLRHG